MALVKLSDVDLVGKLLPWQGASVNGIERSLNMGSKTYGNNEVRTSNNVLIPEQKLMLVVLMSLTSGAATVKIDKHTGAANFGAPDITLNLTGTSLFPAMLALDANDQLGVEVTAGAMGCVLNVVLLATLKVKNTQDFRKVSSALNMYANTDAAPTFTLPS